MLENRLGIRDPVELAREEERISKSRARELFEQNLLARFEVGTFRGLAQIHTFLFGELYDFAGQLRTVSLSKGNLRFASVLYLRDALHQIDQMPQGSFEEIVEKYVEMNVAHPFREGNGRSMRLWLDAMLKSELGAAVDWSRIDREDYLLAMERGPVRDVEIKELLKGALTDQVSDLGLFLAGIDASYAYEGYAAYKAGELHGSKPV